MNICEMSKPRPAKTVTKIISYFHLDSNLVHFATFLIVYIHIFLIIVIFSFLERLIFKSSNVKVTSKC